MERPTKLPIEIRINEWVDGGIEVANPEDYADHNLGWIAVITQRADAVPEAHLIWLTIKTTNHHSRERALVNSPQEEGQPAQNERAHDDAQRAGGLFLAAHFRDVNRILGVDALPLHRDAVDLEVLVQQQRGHL